MKSPLMVHLTLARASNLPTVCSNVLCAYLLVGSLNVAELFAAILSACLLYTAGMYLNDWNDVEFDMNQNPERPIPAKQISRKTVLRWSILYFTTAAIISVSIHPQSLIWLIPLIGCIIVYDLHHKQNSYSPLAMAGCRALIFPWVASMSGESMPKTIIIAAIAVFIFTAGLSYISRFEDFSLSRKAFAIISLFLPALIWIFFSENQFSTISLLAIASYVLWTLYALSGLLHNAPKVGFTVKNLIAGLCLIDLLAIRATIPEDKLALMISATMFALTLLFQTRIPAT